jgi:hypothetical protein
MAEKLKQDSTAPGAPAAPTTTKVRVVKQAISENGLIFTKGQTLDLDPVRADALGELVVAASQK